MYKANRLCRQQVPRARTMKAGSLLLLVGLIALLAGVPPAPAQSWRETSSSSSEEDASTAAEKCPTRVKGRIAQRGRVCLVDCPRNELCCQYGSQQECLLPVGERPGYCPAANPNPATRRCRIRCTADKECGREEKCCWWGCRSSCTGAEPAHPGACPERSALPSGAPGNKACTDDRDCSPQQKCCSTRRGLRCTDLQAGLCELPAQPGSCTSSWGRFHYNSTARACEAFQYSGCQGNANRFRTREECLRVCGETAKGGECPECSEDGKCDSSCSRDSDCPGEERCCRCGCGHLCRLPVGVHPGGYCPKSNASEVAPCLANGTTDAQCGEGRKCCRRGCHGHSAAEPPPPGLCLKRDVPGTTANCESSCNADQDCAPGQKCCFSGCGLQCTDPDIDTCKLPADPGPCDAYTPMFHYSTSAKTCQKFVYGGCGGNGNRFPTLELCLWTCRYRDICKLPLARGHCDSYKISYYYNHTRQSCESFVYRGCDGNENRFQTLEQCRGTCLHPEVCRLPMDPGPCRANIPRYFYNSYNKSCLRFIYGGCHGNRNRFATLEQCEAACLHPGICVLPPETGPCCNFTRMYHYSPAAQECLPFPYGGCKGNANRFPTMENCLETCHSKDVCQLPADPGPCLGSIPQFYYDPLSKKCEQFTYGGCRGNDNRFETQVECIWKCRNLDVCRLPVQPGPCEAATLRYHYNSASKTCDVFLYGGCQGNENNFETLAECEHACKRTDVCRLPPNPGEGDAALPMYHYDPVGKICEQLTYKGRKGNPNRFATLVECQETCRVPDICKLSKEPGPCAASVQRFYFQSSTRRCASFSYGGCRGNLNNFATREECQQTCQGPEKPGSCPLGDAPPCLVTCQKDWECPGAKKCCRSGCGQVCTEPLTGSDGGVGALCPFAKEFCKP